MTQEKYLTVMPADDNRLAVFGASFGFSGGYRTRSRWALRCEADFSVFFREPNRGSSMGFATKYFATAVLGVPIGSNATSDIPLYLRDGGNGIKAKSIGDKDVDDALRRAIYLTPDQRAAMEATCRAQNPFDLRAWQHDALEFFEILRGLR